MAGAAVFMKESTPDGLPTPNPSAEVCEEAYLKLFNTPAKVKAIHAGLECGIFLEHSRIWT
jgi:dipeptidase D